MKKIIALLVFIVTSSIYAQNSGITYQAVIYNPSSEILPGNNNPNVVLAEKDICLRFSIIDVNTNLEYQEVQKVKTDEFGMVNLIVGEGDQVSGYAANFDEIIWNSSNKNLKVEIDTNGNCTNFIEISNQKFASVPFAFASKVAETVSGIVPVVNGGTGAATVAGAKTNLGLNNVDNTSDLNKPVSTATQTALDAKAPLASPGFTGIPTAPTAAAGTSSTQIATTAFVNAALATAASPDATTTLKGRIQLAGDLGGTADEPTVPGLANKENIANKSADTNLGDSNDLYPTQNAVKVYVDSSLAAGVVDATDVEKGKIQLAGDLEGTADAPTIKNSAVIEKVLTGFTPTVGTVMATDNILQAIQKMDGNVGLKANTDSPTFTGTVSGITQGMVGLSNVDNTSDANKPISTAVQTALDTKENTIAAGDTSEYYRGDKSWQTLDKTVVGLSNVDNTADADKPISTATQTALNAKVDVVAGKGLSKNDYTDADKTKLDGIEAEAEKNVNADWNATTGDAQILNKPTIPSIAGLATETFVNNGLALKENAANKSDVTTLGTSDVLFPTQNAVKTYVDTQISANATPDATASDKGKIQLGGDLAGTGSSAASPVITNNAISTNKIANNAVTKVKIAPGSTNSVLVTDGTGAVDWLDQGAFGAIADDSTIEGEGTASDPFKLKDDGITTIKIKNDAVTNAKLADDAVTNAKIGETISVENGGTGATSLTGYLKGNGTSAFTSVSTIPVTDVTGAVRKVNGVQPDANGNVAVIIGRVFTGGTLDPDMATSIINASPAKQQSDIYIIADGTNPNNGRTFIYDGTNWLEVATDLSTSDARYVNVAGDEMEGDLAVPTGVKITIDDAPTGDTDAANKLYVDTKVANAATPDATDLIKGKIKLTNHLGGTADAPTVPDLALKAPIESPSLTGTPLAPTAAAGTNTQQIATTAFVTAATSGMQDAITLTTTGTGAASLVGSTLNIPTPNNGTVTEVSALTIGTSGTDITSTVATSTTTPVVTLNVPTASATNRGALSSADWTTFNDKIGGSGTANFVPKFSAAKTLTDSSIFDDGTKVGIGTDSPANTLEIKQGTAGNSGLRLTNLTASSAATTASSKVLGVNNNGDVILTNVPGTQNIVSFSTVNPNSGSPTFTPAQSMDQSVVYQSSVDNSMWTYNGTNYVTYTPPATTAWNLTGTTNDAGNNKVSSIWRSGGITAGGTSTTPRYGNLTAVGGTNFTGVPAYGTASIGLISNSIPGWSGSGFLFSNSTAGSNAFSMVYNADRAFFAQLTPTNTVTQLGNWGLGGLSIGSGNAALSRLDVFGGLAVGSYAGTNAAPANGLIVSGNLGVGTSSPTTRLQVNSAIAATNTVNVEGIFRLQRPQAGGIKWENIAQFNLGSYAVTTGGSTNATSRLDLAMNDGDGVGTNNVMTWQANGNVGFSTTAPLSLLSNATAGTNFVSSNSATQSATGISWLTNNAGYNTSLYNANNVVGSNGLQVKVANTSSQTIAFEVGQNTSQSGISNPYFNVLGNGNVGVGMNVPTAQFEVATNNGLSALIRRGGAGAQTPANLILQKTSGANAATHGAVVNGDFVGRILFSASNGSSYLTNGTDIVGYAAGTQSTLNNGGGIFFRTVPMNSVAQSVERMRIDDAGRVGIGTSSPTAQLHTTGSVLLAGAGTPGAGKVLTSDAFGNATWQNAVGSTTVSNRTANFTLTASDNAGFIVVNSASLITVTVPATLPAGFYCQIIQQGAGQVQVVGSGVTMNSALGFFTRAQGSSIGIMMATSTTGFVSGDTGL